jgi:hypothetical protein
MRSASFTERGSVLFEGEWALASRVAEALGCSLVGGTNEAYGRPWGSVIFGTMIAHRVMRSGATAVKKEGHSS